LTAPEEFCGCTFFDRPSAPLALGIATEQVEWDGGFSALADALEGWASEQRVPLRIFRYVYPVPDATPNATVTETAKRFLIQSSAFPRRVYISGIYSSQVITASKVMTEFAAGQVPTIALGATASTLFGLLPFNAGTVQLNDRLATIVVFLLRAMYNLQQVWIVYKAGQGETLTPAFLGYREDMLRQAAVLGVPVVEMDVASMPPVPTGTLVFAVLDDADVIQYKSSIVPAGAANTSVFLLTDVNEKLRADDCPEGLVPLALLHQHAFSDASIACNTICAAAGLTQRQVRQYTYYLYDVLRAVLRFAANSNAQPTVSDLFKTQRLREQGYAAYDLDAFSLSMRSMNAGRYTLKMLRETIVANQALYDAQVRSGGLVTEDAVSNLMYVTFHPGIGNHMTIETNQHYVYNPDIATFFGPEVKVDSAGGHVLPAPTALSELIAVTFGFRTEDPEVPNVMQSVSLLEPAGVVGPTMGKTTIVLPTP